MAGGGNDTLRAFKVAKKWNFEKWWARGGGGTGWSVRKDGIGSSSGEGAK